MPFIGLFSSGWGLAGSDAGWCGPVGPGATGVEEAAEPVVVELVEPVAGSLHHFDDEVEPFGGYVGGTGVVMVEDLGPPPERASESSDGPLRTPHHPHELTDRHRP